MIRSRDLVLSCFLVGLALNASAQQSSPAASAPSRLSGHSKGIQNGLRQRTLATWTAWTTSSLPFMTWSPARLDSATGSASALCFYPTGGLSHWFRNLRPRRMHRRAWAMRFSGLPTCSSSETMPTSRRMVSSSAASQPDPRSLAVLSRCGARPKSGMRRTTPSHPREASIHSRFCMLTDASGSPAFSSIMSDQG